MPKVQDWMKHRVQALLMPAVLVMLAMLGSVSLADAQQHKIYYAYHPSPLPNDPSWELLVLWDDSLYYWECNLPNMDHSNREISAGSWRSSGDSLILSSYLEDSLARAKWEQIPAENAIPLATWDLFGNWSFWYHANSKIVRGRNVQDPYRENYHSPKPNLWIQRGQKIMRFDPEYGNKIILKRLRHERNIPAGLTRDHKCL